MIKRVVDTLGACFLLLVCAPILVLIAILIKLDGNGPVFFKQVRVGKGFRHFSRLKFRTEVHEKSQKSDVPEIGGLRHFTRTGRILRQFKLDELPQFLNVLKGEMSLVGPRPEDPYYVDKFRNEYQEILTVRPGLMDLAFLMYDDDPTLFGKPVVKPRVSEAKYLHETIRRKSD